MKCFCLKGRIEVPYDLGSCHPSVFGAGRGTFLFVTFLVAQKMRTDFPSSSVSLQRSATWSESCPSQA